MAFINVTQYLRPDGRRRQTGCEVDDETAQLAQGMVLSAEELTTGQIALYARLVGETEENESLELATNGPGDNSPPNVMARLIRRVAERRAS